MPVVELCARLLAFGDSQNLQYNTPNCICEEAGPAMAGRGME